MRHLAVLLVLLQLATGQWVGWHATWGHPAEDDAAHAHVHGAHHDHHHPGADDDEDCTWCQLAAVAQAAVGLPTAAPATPLLPATVAVSSPHAAIAPHQHRSTTQRTRAPPQPGPSTT